MTVDQGLRDTITIDSESENWLDIEEERQVLDWTV